MAPAPSTPRRTARGRPRGRPKGPSSASASRSKRTTGASATGGAAADGPSTEPPPKRRRYIPGGPGGGGRFVDEDGIEIPPEALGTSTTASRPRASAAANQATRKTTPTVYPRRERSTRIRTAVNRDERDDMQYSSAAAVAAAVVQSEGYKPREERGWEEFHPNLDIEATFVVWHADEVDGIVRAVAVPSASATASGGNHLQEQAVVGSGASVNGTPVRDTGAHLTAAGGGADASGTPNGGGASVSGTTADTPTRRRLGRPARESFSLYATRTLDFGGGGGSAGGHKVPKVLPISGQTSKERLDLKQPQYRKTNRIALFESKTFGQARYVDKSMMNVGYQESDNFIRPDRNLIKATDANMEEEADPYAVAAAAAGGGTSKGDGEAVAGTASAPHYGTVGRVEYDMDEQDDMWLEKLNAQRKATDLDPITREVFEITITKIEKEWHALEKRIPKPNPKPPQTHRPRSSSAAAVNGEPQAGEEQDSKCAICDDGDCENTNAIVFCDGCDLAVHQECYGVPFIPEGQWLCRKCQLIGRGIPTCIFCPNTDGAFKQTNSSKWAHLLCAMWIPEVSLGNHTFMEPVMEVEKVPKTRWRLACYICNQRMGACIQCSNKNCYQAFHVTCARRCRLFLKMKNSQGALAVLDGTLPLKAYCDKHCPPDYAEEHGVAQAAREAKRFYKRTMKGRLWADSQASALQLAATHRNAVTEHPPDESQITGANVSAVLGGSAGNGSGGGDNKKKNQPPKNVWKLPSGAPIIPQAVFDLVESALSRFPIRKRKDFVGEACKYWTLKREARRGAALLKRLQLQMETFSSMELTRRNFAAMGPSGRARLDRRVEFCRGLVDELDRLRELCQLIEERERLKLEAAELEVGMVDTCYFPVFQQLQPILDKAFILDKNVFKQGFQELQDKMDQRYYVTTLSFAQDLSRTINKGIHNPPAAGPDSQSVEASQIKHANYAETAARKRLGKRILKALQVQLETSLKAEAEILHRPYDALREELEGILEASFDARQPSTQSITVSGVGSPAHEGQEQDREQDEDAENGDVDMVDAPAEGQIIVADHNHGDEDAEGELDDAMDGANIEVGGYSEHEHDEGDHKPNGVLSAAPSVAGDSHKPNGFLKASNSPPSLPDASFTTRSNNNNNNPNAQPLTPPRSNTGSASAIAFNPHLPLSTNPSITTTTATGITTTLTDAGTSTTNNRRRPTTANSATSGTSKTGSKISKTGKTGQGNFLTHGGVPWYLAGFALRGTTAVQEQWIPGRDAVRSLSEELTDMDEEALRDLGVDVDGDAEEEKTITIASRASNNTNATKPDRLADGVGEDEDEDADGELDGADADADADTNVDGADDDEKENADILGTSTTPTKSTPPRASTAIKKLVVHGGNNNNTRTNSPSSTGLGLNTTLNGTGTGTGPSTVASSNSSSTSSRSPRKRTRSQVAAAAAAGTRSLRKGVRSSARRK
ncbi:peregrin [Dichotomopilus funicola]|uniref:Peregrin n=1 Tax=Dichotomopilus funicola TaxID=1934379 RepID=A0AAN6V8X5_9PEZI|nr:peregrin [Dichotomopilus funicola]